jgi:hypothetical protein
MRKERCKDGKKYLLVNGLNHTGHSLTYADKIKDFRVRDLNAVSNNSKLLLKADGDNVVRIKANGAKWY